MQKEIHPSYDKVTVTCSCGSVFDTQSTRKGALQIEVCAECHPFYTGKQKLVDTGGRVQKFLDRYQKKEKSAE
ncbi:MAG: 50S ribosomal protein L31 [Legionellaceae bacterium]|nr:50S ribosomal protein L31 [Legionellaceae bacterium]